MVKYFDKDAFWSYVFSFRNGVETYSAFCYVHLVFISVMRLNFESTKVQKSVITANI